MRRQYHCASQNASRAMARQSHCARPGQDINASTKEAPRWTRSLPLAAQLRTNAGRSPRAACASAKGIGSSHLAPVSFPNSASRSRDRCGIHNLSRDDVAPGFEGLRNFARALDENLYHGTKSPISQRYDCDRWLNSQVD
jgi:hypothetical protein